MQFSVYLKEQNPAVDLPQHETSRTWANRILAASLALPVGQNAIHLNVDGSWQDVKNRFRLRTETEVVAVIIVTNCAEPQGLLPPLSHYLPYNYPLPYAFLRMYRCLA